MNYAAQSDFDLVRLMKKWMARISFPPKILREKAAPIRDAYALGIVLPN